MFMTALFLKRYLKKNTMTVFGLTALVMTAITRPQLHGRADPAQLRQPAGR
jgi:hypothetical protein